MTDQKLVDELEKALRDEAYDGGFGYMGDEQFTAYVRTLAETAAEVVEKVLTPTDDEREALANLVQLGFVTDWYEAADRILAAGFRRSEVPEPTEQSKKRLREAADRTSPLSKVPYTSLDLALVRDAAYRASELPEPPGEPSSEVPEPSAECPQCHRPDGLHKLGCGERFSSEPQGEPSDAQTRRVAHTGPGHASGDAGYCEGCLADYEQGASGHIPGEPLTLEDLAREHERLAEHPNQMSQTIPAFHTLTAKALRWAALRAAGGVR